MMRRVMLQADAECPRSAPPLAGCPGSRSPHTRPRPSRPGSHAASRSAVSLACQLPRSRLSCSLLLLLIIRRVGLWKALLCRGTFTLSGLDERCGAVRLCSLLSLSLSAVLSVVILQPGKTSTILQLPFLGQESLMRTLHFPVANCYTSEL